MEYYNATEIIKITGLSKSSVYNLINNLNTKLKREYPGTITISGRVPRWYFDKKLMIKEEGNKNEKKI